MRRKVFVTDFLAHLVLAALIALILWQGEALEACVPFLAALALIEGFYWIKRTQAGKRPSRSPGDILLAAYLVLFLWELSTTSLHLLHPVLFPTPERVFAVFRSSYKPMLAGVFSSAQLLFFGLLVGTTAGVLIGLVAGWNPRLSGFVYPIAQVLTPIPPIVYSPYLVAIMPTFRSASALVLFIGIFFPTLLNTILRVHLMDRRIIDSARSLNVRGFAMLRYVLFPYVLPGVLSGLKVTLSTSIMLLIFAEMMGSTSGMGYFIINAVHYANYANVVAGIILVGIVVTLLNRLATYIQKHVIRWQ